MALSSTKPSEGLQLLPKATLSVVRSALVGYDRSEFPSVDTSKPAIHGRGKSGHRVSAQASVL